MVAVFGDALREVIGGGVDLIFCNKDEAMAFTGTESLEAAAEGAEAGTPRPSPLPMARMAPLPLMAILMNQSKGVEAKAIDTNGAGDMFAGAFLYAITSGKSYAWAAKPGE